ncbi:hypothetical protein GCM10010371_68640 [Streptomyces subrutilus]|uniref:Uncharacterized protein n=1 Tax=Streptomyces subrutilus TaxID=36818 RepID=A0A918RIT6_9ACTN|nr:hypothetical protein [Streptomyces subrutilus]GGZ99475.1 hypothetical protein GCM10010371_68640 [Streptomyces subrutilus]
MEAHKARGIAAIHGAGATPGKGIDTIETALHRAETCGVDLHPHGQWGQINTITTALQPVHHVFREQAGPAFPELWADEHVADWLWQVSLTACTRIAELGLQRATPTAGPGGHPGVAALRAAGRAALVYTALADPAPAAPSTRPDPAIDLDEPARAAAPGAPDLHAQAAARAQNTERAAARRVSAPAARSRSTPTRRAPGQPAPPGAVRRGRLSARQAPPRTRRRSRQAGPEGGQASPRRHGDVEHPRECWRAVVP